jgi:hypothetical protein
MRTSSEAPAPGGRSSQLSAAIGGATLVSWTLGSLAARLPVGFGAALALSALTVAAAVFVPAPLSGWRWWPRCAETTGGKPLQCMAMLALLIWLAGSLMRPPLGEFLDALLVAVVLLMRPAGARWLQVGALWIVCVGLALLVIGAIGLQGLGIAPPPSFPAIAGVAFVAAAWFAVSGLSGRVATGAPSLLTRTIYGAVSLVVWAAALLASRVSPGGDAGPTAVLGHVMGGFAPVAVVGLAASSLVVQALLALEEASSSRDRPPFSHYGLGMLGTAVIMALAAFGLRAAMPAWDTGGYPGAAVAVLLAVVLSFAPGRLQDWGRAGGSPLG